MPNERIDINKGYSWIASLELAAKIAEASDNPEVMAARLQELVDAADDNSPDEPR
jgi:hypothetical protein